jgi:hypothetical protein
MVKVWDLRAPGCQREYGSRAAVNTVVLHPNQGELISGERSSAGLSGCCTAARQALCCCCPPPPAYRSSRCTYLAAMAMYPRTCMHSTIAP